MWIREKTTFRLERSGTEWGAVGRGRKAREKGECAFCFAGSKSLARALCSPSGLAEGSPHAINSNVNLQQVGAGPRAVLTVLGTSDVLPLMQKTMSSCARLTWNFSCSFQRLWKSHWIRFIDKSKKTETGGPVSTVPHLSLGWNSPPSARRSSRFTITAGWITWNLNLQANCD